MADIRNGRLPSFLGLVAMLLLGYWLLTAPDFRVTNVQVKGGRFLNLKDIVAMSALDQQNIFLLNEEDVAARIKNLPYVLEVHLTKALPNAVTVDVTERHSMLNWRMGSVNYLVDPEGVVLETMIQLSPDANNLTVIKSLDDKPLKVGERVDPVAVRSAPLILKKLEENKIGIVSLDYSPTSGLIAMGIKEQGSRKILLGTDAELDKKMSILKTLLQDQTLKWTFADLRFTAKPVIQ
jgi:cell division protein FtsQ